MPRHLFVCGALLVGLAVLGSDPAHGQGKKAGGFTGRIIGVGLDANKKVESLTVEVRANEISERKVRVDDQTKFEYSGILNKDDYAPRIGFSVDVKLRAGTDVADQLKISPTGAKGGGAKKKKDKS